MADKPLLRIDFARSEIDVLAGLYWHYTQDSSEALTVSELSEVSGVAPNIVRDILAELIDQSLVKRMNLYREGRSGSGYRLRREGAIAAENRPEFVAAFAEIGTRIEGEDTAESWEPLPIDISSAQYKDAVESTEKAISEIEASNGYATSSPDERNTLISTLKSGLSSLKTGWISRPLFRATLLTPLGYIAKKFADTGLGEIAKRAVHFLLSLLD